MLDPVSRKMSFSLKASHASCSSERSRRLGSRLLPKVRRRSEYPFGFSSDPGSARVVRVDGKLVVGYRRIFVT